MNIKLIKALRDKDVYPEWFLERHTGGTPHLIEDIKDDPNTEVNERARCMPYHSYPIPSVEQLCVMITDYASEDEVGVKIDAQMTPMGFMMYAVTVRITCQDTVTKVFPSPFLKDALAEALLALKENSNEKASEEQAKG